jgi:hypothetical protein
MNRTRLIAVLVLVLGAGALAILVIGGGDDSEDPGAVARACSEDQSPPLTKAPQHARYRALSHNQRLALGQAFGSSGIPPALITGRRVTITTGQGTGVTVVNSDPDLVAVPGPGNDEVLYDQFERSFRNAAEAQRLTISEDEIEGKQVLLARRFGLVNVIGTAGCYGFAAFTSRPVEARAIAAAVIAEGETG